MTQKRTRLPLTVLAGAMLLPVFALPVQAGGTKKFDGNLTDIIPALYGGDGILLEVSPLYNHAAHFLADSLIQFNNLSLSMRDLSFPVINPQAGIKFRYDTVLDEFVPATGSLGASVFAFDADTLGKGEFRVGLAFSQRNFNRLEGQSLNDVVVDLHHLDIGDNGDENPCIGGPPGACYEFERDVIRLNMRIKLKEEMMALTAAYGLSDRVDIGLFVPILQTEMSVRSRASIIENPTIQYFSGHLHYFGPNSDRPVDALAATRTGLGDTVVRLNYWAEQATGAGWDVSIGADVRLPTGDEANLQGLPGIGVRPRVVASRVLDFLGGKLKPHINLAYGFNAGIKHEQLIEYAAGASYTFTWKDGRYAVALAADFLGKNIVWRKDGRGDNQYDLSLGAKLHLFRQANLYYSMLLPLNSEGLRPDMQHVFGVQVKF